jgi:polyisoprenoid-binding protein YceI
MRLKFVVAAILLGVSWLYAGEYRVDPVNSQVHFAVKHMLISTVRGHFDKFSGSFTYDEKSKKLSALTGTIETKSVNTGNSMRDADLRSSNFFDAKQYPKIIFTLTDVKGQTAYGKLTIHGITKTVHLHLKVSGLVVKDPWGNIRTGIALTGEINRQDFGLKWNKMLAAGGALVGNTVKLDIALEGILKK